MAFDAVQPEPVCDRRRRYAVILAGGKGERFWPYSRAKLPKHLLCLAGADQLICQTFERLKGVVPEGQIYVITHSSQREGILAACKGLRAENLILEPVAKDTAPAIAVATLWIQRLDPKATLLFLPADQKIDPLGPYHAALEAAFACSEEYPAIITFGIVPSFAATGYGYMRKGPLFKTIQQEALFGVGGFVEKPDIATAKSYIARGTYLWNTGFFVGSTSTLRKAYEKHAPSIHTIIQAIEADLETGTTWETAVARHYERFEKRSFDYAVLEKASNLLMLEAKFSWDDLGSWLALERHTAPDTHHNIRKGLTLLHECRNNIIVSDPKHLIGALGVDDMIIVHTPDATLVCPKHKSERIKELMKILAENEGLRAYL